MSGLSRAALACFSKKATVFDMNKIPIADIPELPIQERICLVLLSLSGTALQPFLKPWKFRLR